MDCEILKRIKLKGRTDEGTTLFLTNFFVPYIQIKQQEFNQNI